MFNPFRWIKEPFRWIKKLDQAPHPHDIINGLKKSPVHLVGFSPFGIVAHFLPPPYNFVFLGGFAAWRTVEEYRDNRRGDDTVGKAIVDAITQTAGTAVGTFFHP